MPPSSFQRRGASSGDVAAFEALLTHAHLNYAGICAGAFLAGSSSPHAINLTGVRFPFYGAESRGIRKMAVVISTPGEPPLDQY